MEGEIGKKRYERMKKVQDGRKKGNNAWIKICRESYSEIVGEKESRRKILK